MSSPVVRLVSQGLFRLPAGGLDPKADLMGVFGHPVNNLTERVHFIPKEVSHTVPGARFLWIARPVI